MPMTQEINKIKAGYHHDESGRWIDCSYNSYTLKISGYKEVLKLLSIEHAILDACRTVHENLKTTSLKYAADAQHEYKMAHDEYLALPLWRKCFVFMVPQLKDFENPKSYNLKRSMIEVVTIMSEVSKRVEYIKSLDFGIPSLVEIEITGKKEPLERTLMPQTIHLSDTKMVSMIVDRIGLNL